MERELKTLSLDRIGNGAIPELFAHELNRVLMNIDDPNTDPKKVRRITISLDFHPTQTRDAAAVDVKVKSNLPSSIGITSPIYLAREHGVLTAFVVNPKQQVLDLKPKLEANGGGES